MDLSPHTLPAVTQATLLLCAPFGQKDHGNAKPLTPAEFNRLRRQQADLAALLRRDHADELAEVVDPERLRALLARGALLALAVEKWAAAGLWVLSRDGDGYPARLRQQLGDDAPPLLYGVGERELLEQGGLAVVGARDAADEALEFARAVAGRCAKEGIGIVSGGARGVDAAAIAGTLDNGGRAVAVLADHLLRAATARGHKTAIREGRLTLATPQDPEASFTVWHAMGRNQCLYALADFALVVQFTTGSGGTWTGAVEQLARAERTPGARPVLVRAQGNPPYGVQQLLDKGARPFPEEAWQGSCRALLEVASRPPPRPPLPAGQPGDFYTAALPLLLEALREPCDKAALKAFAQERQLSGKQLELWLRRAVEEGHVRKKRSGKVLRYAARLEPTLFEQAPTQAEPDA